MSTNHNPNGPEADEWAPRKPEKPALPKPKFNPDLTVSEIKHGKRPGDVYVQKVRLHDRVFRRMGPGRFVATAESDRPDNPLEIAYRAFKRVLIGHRLVTAEEVHQRLNKIKALAVFGSDPISSCAYATEEAMLVLIAAGSGALGISFFLALAVSMLLSMVAFSYRQTVYAYPHGGGSYNVSRENLGQIPGLVAAAALLIDYVLTVSVSIVAGAAAVSSALIASGYGDQVNAINATLPSNLNVNVLLSILFISILTWGNLRGIRESGAIFSFPTYLFIGSLCLTLAVGLFKSLHRRFASRRATPVHPWDGIANALADLARLLGWLRRDERHRSDFERRALFRKTGIEKRRDDVNHHGDFARSFFPRRLVPGDAHELGARRRNDYFPSRARGVGH